MHVLHINEHLQARGGIETYLIGLLPRLEQRGVRASVGFEHGDASLWKRSVFIPRLGGVSRMDRKEGALSCARLLDEECPDVVHLHNIHNTGVIEACLDRSPVVITGHDYRYLCPASNFYHRRTGTVCHRTCGPGCFATTVAKHCLTPRPRFALGFYSRVQFMTANWHRVAAVVAPSAASATRFERAGYAKGRLHVIPYFCPVPVVERRHLESDPPTLTYIGRLSANKGYSHFITALGRLPHEVRGIMVGNLDPRREAELMTLAESAGCGDRLVLKPWADRGGIQEVLAQTTILVFPSIWEETLGIVGLEALANGVPVVASDIGGVREWLRPGVTGCLVPPGDPGAIAGACADLLDSPALRERMGLSGISMMSEVFSPDRHLDLLTDLYARAAREGTGLGEATE